MTRVGVVVVAAGSGERLGAAGPKALVPLAGRSLLRHALDGLAAAGLPAPVVVHPQGQAGAFVAAVGEQPVAAWVTGGATRTDSVTAGVAALPEDVEVVVVHDAARPLTPPPVIAATVAAVLTGARTVLAAAPGLPVADTLKRTIPAPDTGAGVRAVVATVDRTGLVGVQTPQVFPRAVLGQALQAAADADGATDDLALVERLRDRGRLSGTVLVVPGSPLGHKVTYPADLALLERLLGAEGLS